MQKDNGWVTLAGFILFFMGFLSILVSMVGVQFSFMTWMDHWGRGLGFLFRLILLLAGIILIIMDRTAKGR